MQGRAGSGRAAHGKEDPHRFLCGKPCGRTRVPSVRQLPTDHDYAASTREYQTDQPSKKLSRSLPALPLKAQTIMKPNTKTNIAE